MEISQSNSLDPRKVELLQLQKEYRHMEITRRAYAEESQALLKKQQSTIEKLRGDNEAIKSDIAIIMRSTNRPLTSTQQETLQKMHDQGDRYANAIEFENKNIETMEEQIAIMKQKALHQRRAMGGVNASKDNYHMIQKQIRILENRLDKALVKFNEAIAHNKTLRESIDDLRRERVVFENIYRKMERELQDRKQKMAEIIELSNQSYEQRDNYQMEVAAIEQANRKEQDEFEEQMVKLGELLESELRLPTPGSTLGRFAKSSSNKYIGDATAGSIEDINGSSMAKSMKATNWTAVASDSNTFDRVQNFEEAFNKIKAATGITDIEELVRTFIKNEDHNFSLFNYVNEQNNEVEKLEEQIQLLREEERKFAQESGDDVIQHKQVLKELETKLQTTESMAEKYEIRCQDLQRVIESLKRGIQSIYEKFDVDEDGFGDPLVTESNMVHYLGQIEQKTNQLLQAYAEIKQSLMKPATLATSGFDGKGDSAGEEFSPSKSLVSILGSGPKLPMGHDLVHVNPPKIDDYQSEEDDDEDDEDARPLTREELKTRTLNRMQRKYQGGAKGNTKKKAAASKMNTTR